MYRAIESEGKLLEKLQKWQQIIIDRQQKAIQRGQRKTAVVKQKSREAPQAILITPQSGNEDKAKARTHWDCFQRERNTLEYYHIEVRFQLPLLIHH